MDEFGLWLDSKHLKTQLNGFLTNLTLKNKWGNDFDEIEIKIETCKQTSNKTDCDEIEWWEAS